MLRFHTAEPRRASSHFGLSGFTGSVPDPPFLLPSSPARNRFVLSFISPIASASISRSISPHLLLSAQFNTPLNPPPPPQVPHSILLALVLGSPVLIHPPLTPPPPHPIPRTRPPRCQHFTHFHFSIHLPDPSIAPPRPHPRPESQGEAFFAASWHSQQATLFSVK